MRRRRIALAVLGLAALGGGVYAWHQLRFPARSEAIAGTPVTMRLRDSVDNRSAQLVRDGIALMHRYLAEAAGGAQRRPVEARVAKSNPCVPFGALAGFSSEGVADTWQAENGCLFDESDHTHQWLFEGVAAYMPWQALIRHGDATRAELAENLRFYGARRGDLAPLRAHEREGGDARLYAKWQLAVRRLTSHSLLRFCRAIGRKHAWHGLQGRLRDQGGGVLRRLRAQTLVSLTGHAPPGARARRHHGRAVRHGTSGRAALRRARAACARCRRAPGAK